MPVGMIPVPLLVCASRYDSRGQSSSYVGLLGIVTLSALPTPNSLFHSIRLLRTAYNVIPVHEGPIAAEERPTSRRGPVTGSHHRRSLLLSKPYSSPIPISPPRPLSPVSFSCILYLESCYLYSFRSSLSILAALEPDNNSPTHPIPPTVPPTPPMAIQLEKSQSYSGPRTTHVDTPAHQAVDKLASRVKTAQMANALRARMSFAGFKSLNKLEQTTINELEQKLPQTQSTGPAVGTRRSIDSLLPDQVLAKGQSSLYTSLLSPRATKRTRRTDSNVLFSPPRKPITSSATSPAFFNHPNTDLKPSPRVKMSVRKHPPPPNPKAPTAKDDMKAAATLTSLMMSSKNSAHSAATSPRALSRTSSDASDSGRIASIPPRDSNSQHHTPPMSPKSTKHEAMENKEAAELMMFLATSPSPARKPAVKHNIPQAATRILFLNSQRPEEAARQSRTMNEREKTFVLENDPIADSSQASTTTLVELSQPHSMTDTQSSIPFPVASSSWQSHNSVLRSPSNFAATSMSLKSPLRSQEYHLGGPSINLNGHTIAGSGPIIRTTNRNQFSPSKVQTSTLGAGINLTT